MVVALTQYEVQDGGMSTNRGNVEEKVMSEPTGIEDSARYDTEAKPSAPKSTLVICGECGKGNFHQHPANVSADFFCTECDAEVTWADFEGNGSEGETLVIVDGLLIVVTVSS